MHKLFIVNKPGVSFYAIPLLWASAKTYYEETSKYANYWEWGTPNLPYDHFDQLLALLVKEKPTLVGFSVYIWNEGFIHKLAKQLKLQLNDVIIVFGGPQVDIKYNSNFFNSHPYVDLVIPSDAYGEISIADILDNIIENNSLIADNIPYSYRPSHDKTVLFNNLSPNKREFKWPKNPYRAQQQHILPIVQNYSNTVASQFLLIETSRGCPYKCSFCDWGGGVYTKVVKKDFSTVLDEITWAGENKIEGIGFADANFGAFNIDIEYVKHLIEVHKKYQFPTIVKISPSKSKIENLFKIYSLLAEYNLLSHYQIAIQDLDDDVKKNVDRIDFSFEEQIEMFKRLQKQKYLPIYIETILGLPGSSIATVRDSIHRISLEKLAYPIGNYWALLPATPAYESSYRNKYKLITVKDKSSAGAGSYPLKIKLHAFNESEDKNTEYVVGSFSYSPNDWIDMQLLQIFTAVVQNSEMLNVVADYLWQKHEIKYGDFFEHCLNTILNDSSVNQQLQQNLLKFKNILIDWLAGNTHQVYCDYSHDIPYLLAPPNYMLFIFLIQIDAFFEAVLISLANIINITDDIVDLCLFSQQRLIDYTYVSGRIITTRYDWPNYINTNILVKEVGAYQLLDSSIITNGSAIHLHWNNFTEYIDKVCCDARSKKIAVGIDKLT